MRRTAIHTITFTAETFTPTVAGEKGGLYLLKNRSILHIDDNERTARTTPVDYAPGSSLKGRMRLLLEKEWGKVTPNSRGVGGPCQCSQGDCPVCRIFGAHSTDSNLGPSRIMVRDGRVKGELGDGENGARVGELAMEIVLQVYDEDAQFSYTRQRGGGTTYRGDEALQAVVADGLRMVTEPGRSTRNRRHTGRIRFYDFMMDGAPWTIWSDSN